MAKTFESRRTVAEGAPALAVRPGTGMLGIARAETTIANAPVNAGSEGTLIVGNGIFVRGEIDSCHTLVVEGRVEASLEAESLNVRKGGVYQGKAVAEAACIGGQFEGELTVRGLLTIDAGGRVSGTIRYSEIMIKTGGQIRGDVGLIPSLVAEEDVA